jgi:hypothetical protein
LTNVKNGSVALGYYLQWVAPQVAGNMRISALITVSNNGTAPGAFDPRNLLLAIQEKVYRPEDLKDPNPLPLASLSIDPGQQKSGLVFFTVPTPMEAVAEKGEAEMRLEIPGEQDFR